MNKNNYQLPQEKLMFSGIESLSEIELMALVLRTGTRDKSVLELASEVMEYAEELSIELSDLDVHELLSINGVGKSKACSIVAGLELARRIRCKAIYNQAALKSSQDVANFVMEKMHGEKREHVLLFLVNTKCQIESQHIVSIGELSSANIHPREVFNIAIRRSAAGIIIAHNHPSGDPTPSADDLMVTKRIASAGELIGIKVLDHVVVGKKEFVSLKAEGVI